ncbi:D-glycerate dehydrogenase [Streptomyces sp. AD2-2]|nr:D-glycerate dehydrogenase [Streptomyces sp. AD2-2]
MHIVLTRPIHTSEARRLRDAGHQVTELAGPDGLPPAWIAPHRAGADSIISHLTDTIDAAVLATPGLRVVANVAAGYDNIDLRAAASHDIVVTHTPGVLTEASADLALALMLAVARHVPAEDATVRSGGTGPWQLLHEPMGTDLSGAVLGIVGMGRIGRATACRARFGFGMEVLYTSRRPHPEAEEQLNATRVPLEALLRRSDIVSLHTALTEETRHLIKMDTLALMKPGAILVNTARGGLIKEEDLAHALIEGTLAGAGLDVFENEPEVHPALLACGSRTVLTPHIGSATARTRLAMAALAVDNVLAVLAGRPALHPVT